MHVKFLLISLVALGCGPWAMAGSYEESIQEWRVQRLKTLTAETGYLAVAGFAWLEPGDNTVGSSPQCRVVLPPGTAPQQAGILHIGKDGELEVRFRDEAKATIDGDPVGSRKLPYDVRGSDRIHIGRITFWVMERGGRPAVRILDPECPIRKNFKGFENYAIDPAFRVRARWEPLENPVEVRNRNYLGYEELTPAYGHVVFELGGKSHRLTPFQESAQDSVLFLVFEDETSTTETYGGGRFLYANIAADGSVDLDFNKAYNPPCAFNPYTTCPLPLEGNSLAVKITAGEKAPTGVRY